eukprot:5512675-Amphidinium_carterae.1
MFLVVASSLIVGVPVSLLVSVSELSSVCQVTIWPSIRCKLNSCDHNVCDICASGRWDNDPQEKELQATLSSPSMLWSLVARAIAVDLADVFWACFCTALFGHIAVRLILM